MFVDILRQVNSASALDPAGQPLRRGCDPDVAASVESIFRLIPSRDEQRELYRVLERIHPADARTFLENVLPYDVEYSDYSDCDGYDELDCYSDPANYYAPTDIEFMHELHGPDKCGVYCQLRYEIEPYGHYAQTDGELSHAMHDPASYDSGPGKISPESGSVMAMSDFADDIDAELGEPSLPSGVHLDMPDLTDVDNVSQAPEYASFGELESRMMFLEFGNVLAMSDFAVDVDVEPGEPSLPSGVHLDIPDLTDIDSVSQVPECVGFSHPGLPCWFGKIPRRPGIRWRCRILPVTLIQNPVDRPCRRGSLRHARFR